MSNEVLTISKNIKCPECQRKLCKVKKIENNIFSNENVIEFRHKGSFVFFESAAIGCLDCRKVYHVTADEGIITEIIDGRE